MIGGTASHGRITQMLLAFTCVLCCATLAPAAASAAGTGSIGGAVSEAAGAGGPIESTQVCAHEQGGAEVSGCQDTDSSGDYTIEDLPEGEYLVEFNGKHCAVKGGEEICSPEWAGQDYAGVFSVFFEGEEMFFGGTPTPVHVNEGAPSPGIDAGLYAMSRIEGTATSASGPIADMRVCVDGINGLYYPACTVTDGAGNYSFVDVPPGEYLVEFSGEVCEAGASECSAEACKEERISCTRPYIPQFYDAASSWTEAEQNPWRVEPGETLEANATLLSGGKIEGTVTVSALGAPGLGGIEVCALPESEGVSKECTKTEANGQYAIEGLASGPYKVEFTGEECIEKGVCYVVYLSQLFHEAGSSEAELLVNVTAPEASMGIDASMVERSPSQPVFLTAPELSGTPSVGATLSCSEGTWSNNPTSIAYLWERNGVAIPGENGNAYTVTREDEGASLVCHVTVKNAAGSASATSNALHVREAAAAKETPAIQAPTPEAKAGVAVAGAKASAVRTVMVRLACTGAGACKGSLKLVYKEKLAGGKHRKARTKKVTIGTASYAIAAAESETIAVKLTRKGARYVARSGKHGLKVTLAGSGLKPRTLLVKLQR